MTSRNAFTRGPTAPALSYARFTPPGNPTPDDAPDEAATGAALARARAVLGRHGEQPPPSAAPDPGVILAEIDRGDGTTMRVCWRLFEGKPFVAVGVWAGGWPVKGKQTTVKVRELAAVLDGLVAAVEKRDEARRP
jgi:hypothetical protein